MYNRYTNLTTGCPTRIGSHDTQHNYIQHNNYWNATLSITTLSLNDTEHNNAVIMLRVICAECLKETDYADCCYAKCHYAEGHGTFSNASGNNTIVI
jgi:hypothetical protein